MPNIDITKNRTTLINVFVVKDRLAQDALIESLKSVTIEVMRHLPGYVAASVHRGLDDKHVINYAQWQSVDHFKAMLGNPAVHPHMQEIKAITSDITPILYEVAFVDELPD